MTTPPERIPLIERPAFLEGQGLEGQGLEELELCRWRVDDAGRVYEAVTASFDHLHPWMPWAAKRPTFEAERAFVRQAILDWDLGRVFAYGIFDRERTSLLGSSALLNPADPIGEMEIGYWVHAAHTGRGLATAAAAALTRAAFALPGVTSVRIRCDENNISSLAIPRRLGYRLVRTETREPAAPAEAGRLLVWILTDEAFLSDPPASL